MLTDSEIEIRQVFTAEDFGEAFTPELPHSHFTTTTSKAEPFRHPCDSRADE